MVAKTHRDAIAPEAIAGSSASIIPDDRAYRAVIRVLDRLFERGEGRTPAETESFRMLARLAHQYELDHPACWA